MVRRRVYQTWRHTRAAVSRLGLGRARSSPTALRASRSTAAGLLPRCGSWPWDSLRFGGKHCLRPRRRSSPPRCGDRKASAAASPSRACCFSPPPPPKRACGYGCCCREAARPSGSRVCSRNCVPPMHEALLSPPPPPPSLRLAIFHRGRRRMGTGFDTTHLTSPHLRRSCQQRVARAPPLRRGAAEQAAARH